MVAIVWKWLGGRGCYKYHVRTRESDEDINAGEIARLHERFRGGGHPSSSGMTVSSKESVELVFDLGPEILKSTLESEKLVTMAVFEGPNGSQNVRVIHSYYEPLSLAKAALEKFSEELVCVWKKFKKRELIYYIIVKKDKCKLDMNDLFDRWAEAYTSATKVSMNSISIMLPASCISVDRIVQFTTSTDDFMFSWHNMNE